MHRTSIERGSFRKGDSSDRCGRQEFGRAHRGFCLYGTGWSDSLAGLLADLHCHCFLLFGCIAFLFFVVPSSFAQAFLLGLGYYVLFVALRKAYHDLRAAFDLQYNCFEHSPRQEVVPFIAF